MPTVQMALGRDVQGIAIQKLWPPSQNIYNAKLASGTATNVVVPAVYPEYIAVFSVTGSSDVFCDCTGAAAVAPTSGTLVSATAELIPTGYMYARLLPAGTNISVITDSTTATISISFYSANSWGR